MCSYLDFILYSLLVLIANTLNMSPIMPLMLLHMYGRYLCFYDTYIPASSSRAVAVNTAVPEGCFSRTVSRYMSRGNRGLLSFTSDTFTRIVANADCLGTPVSAART